jgi:hypothetical protein
VTGAEDLDQNGRWIQDPTYGQVWQPSEPPGWAPYQNGQWVWEDYYGWTWVSYQPWGWAPYHYGGWLFDAGCGGWFYSPPMYYGYYPGGPIKRPPKRVNPPRPVYHAATAVFVRNNGKLGVVPMHPLDQKGKAPLNLEHGVFAATGSKEVSAQLLTAAAGEKWETLKSAPKDAFRSGLAPATPPIRASRNLVESASGTRVVTTSKESSIAYDPVEHRFVNSNNAPTTSEKENRAEPGKANVPPAKENPRNPAAFVSSASASSK